MTNGKICSGEPIESDRDFGSRTLAELSARAVHLGATVFTIFDNSYVNFYSCTEEQRTKTPDTPGVTYVLGSSFGLSDGLPLHDASRGHKHTDAQTDLTHKQTHKTMQMHFLDAPYCSMHHCVPLSQLQCDGRSMRGSQHGTPGFCTGSARVRRHLWRRALWRHTRRMSSQPRMSI